MPNIMLANQAQYFSVFTNISQASFHTPEWRGSWILLNEKNETPEWNDLIHQQWYIWIFTSRRILANFERHLRFSGTCQSINPLKWLMGKRIAIFKVYLYYSKSWKLRLLVTERYILWKFSSRLYEVKFVECDNLLISISWGEKWGTLKSSVCALYYLFCRQRTSQIKRPASCLKRGGLRITSKPTINLRKILWVWQLKIWPLKFNVEWPSQGKSTPDRLQN